MASERRDIPEQERSIKDRGQELFVEAPASEPARPPAKPFAVYLQETPAAPMSAGVKALLWVVGVIVLLILVLAIVRSQRPRRGRPRAKPQPTASAQAPTRALASVLAPITLAPGSSTSPRHA